MIISVLLNVSANLLLKTGVKETGGFLLEQTGIFSVVIKAIKSPYIWGGLISYAFSFILWLRILTSMDLSKAYPLFATIVFLLTTAGSSFFLKEIIPPQRLIGIIFILLGIYLVSRF